VAAKYVTKYETILLLANTLLDPSYNTNAFVAGLCPGHLWATHSSVSEESSQRSPKLPGCI